jgi:hypothetical protein
MSCQQKIPRGRLFTKTNERSFCYVSTSSIKSIFYYHLPIFAPVIPILQPVGSDFQTKIFPKKRFMKILLFI